MQDTSGRGGHMLHDRLAFGGVLQNAGHFSYPEDLRGLDLLLIRPDFHNPSFLSPCTFHQEQIYWWALSYHINLPGWDDDRQSRTGNLNCLERNATSDVAIQVEFIGETGCMYADELTQNVKTFTIIECVVEWLRFADVHSLLIPHTTEPNSTYFS